ncbi:MAG TPA: hypothetical protein VE442_08810 [Jatrophihabitans sp.]|nr:hypothetical protein [Jatrophihabitans sp.]
MKVTLAALVSVPLIGLAIVGAIILPLLIMILPLLAVALLCGWGILYASSVGRARKVSEPRGRHVVESARAR